MTAQPFYIDDQATLHHGDSLAVLRTLPDESVDAVVTSPPYYGLRDYGVPGQYGLEASPAGYVDTMRAVFAEVRRVLAKDGTLWLNIGDSYSSKAKGSGGTGRSTLMRDGRAESGRRSVDAAQARQAMPVRQFDMDVPEKNLLGIPWRVAFALQDDGWILRSDIAWQKPNAMPESATDRPSCTHEHVFLFARSPRYWFDLDPIREPLAYPEALDGTRVFGGKNGGRGKVGGSARRGGGDRSVYGSTVPGHTGGPKNGGSGPHHEESHPKGRNPGDVWAVSTSPFPEAHFAVMPPELARRCIVSGCKPGGVVLDPFCGSGTTGMVALKHGRRFVGIDLSSAYLDLALKTRLRQGALIEDAS